MIGIFLLIYIATSFSKLAFDKNLNRYVWGTIGVASYFISQVISGLIISEINPELLNGSGSVTIIGLITGLMGVGIAYLILQRMPEKQDILSFDRDLLDGKMD